MSQFVETFGNLFVVVNALSRTQCYNFFFQFHPIFVGNKLGRSTFKNLSTLALVSVIVGVPLYLCKLSKNQKNPVACTIRFLRS